MQRRAPEAGNKATATKQAEGATHRFYVLVSHSSANLALNFCHLLADECVGWRLYGGRGVYLNTFNCARCGLLGRLDCQVGGGAWLFDGVMGGGGLDITA